MKPRETLDRLSARMQRRRKRLDRHHTADQVRRSAAAHAYIQGRRCWICERYRHCQHREPGVVDAEIDRRMMGGKA